MVNIKRNASKTFYITKFDLIDSYKEKIATMSSGGL